MFRMAIIPLVLSGLSPALAQTGARQMETCHVNADTGDLICYNAPARDRTIITGVPEAPLTEADVALRNPIAPQSNYTARTIEDDQVFAAQVVLRKNGCYDGRLDGVLTDGTVYAIKLFEANMGLIPTGKLSDETEAALRASHDRFDICR